ncbi:protein mesh-like isoform X2 [Dysidea avara]|uniref:protein mesh-like isoform X2 n=1 Tax=Dysidea avara TaxID=196820 RepID=UPI00332AEAA8
MTYQLVLLLLVHSVIGIPLQDFFPFNGSAVCLYDTSTGLVHTSNVLDVNGVSVDDVTGRDCEEFRLTPNDDGSSYSISIGFSFPFFTKKFRNVFINTNGIISFTEPQNVFIPEMFPVPGKFLISPYWVDADTRGIGDIFFKVTSNASQLLRANVVIQRATVQGRGLLRFNPRWMLIATWFNVGYFSTQTDKTNTFQALLVTDGRHSFVVFNYLDDGINWIGEDASQVDAQVGFNFGGEILRSYSFPTSRTTAIADIEKDSNTGSPGQYVYRGDSTVIRNVRSLTVSQCDDLPILVDPDTPSIINGGVMTLTGPSFDTTSSHEKITCVFTDDDGDVTEGFPRGFTRLINGIVVNCKAICPMPLFRKLGSHNLTVVLNDRRYVGEFEVVLAVFKTPDVHIYDGDGELEFALIEYGRPHMARWNPEQVKKDQFKENCTITFSVENWFFFLGGWQKRGHGLPVFNIVHTDYDNGNVTFLQRINRPRIFHFEISVIVLVKHTKNLNIMYTSSILSFAQKLFGQFTGETALLKYCNLWFAESNEIIKHSALQACPCTVEGIIFDPEFVSDPTCSSFARKCHENINAAVCYLKSLNVINFGQQCCYDTEGKYITTNGPAGSADYYFPGTHYLQHQSSDYFPYKVCCVDSNPTYCAQYYERRPIAKDNGTVCTSTESNKVCDPLVAPDNGDIDCSLGDDGAANIRDTCTFTCDDKFKLHGSAMRECQFQHGKGTSWSGNEARCEPVGRICPTLMAPENGMINCSLGDDGVPTNGDTCTFTCDVGFMLQGGTIRQCRTKRRMRNWNGDEARCVQVPAVTAPSSCKPLSAPNNGMIDCSLGDDGVPTNGDMCTFTCNNGFDLSGSQTNKCRIRNNRGKWTGNQATCNNIMGCVDIKSITVQIITRGKTATVTFSSHSDATFTCQLDSGTAVACTSPQKFSRLSRGSHSITLVSTCPGKIKGLSHTSTFRIRRA